MYKATFSVYECVPRNKSALLVLYLCTVIKQHCCHKNEVLHLRVLDDPRISMPCCYVVQRGEEHKDKFSNNVPDVPLKTGQNILIWPNKSPRVSKSEVTGIVCFSGNCAS